MQYHLLSSALMPRPTAWMSVLPASDMSSKNDVEQLPIVCLVEGYCGASDRPPTLMVGSDSIAPAVLDGLRRHQFCTLSVATEREWRMDCNGGNVVQSMCAPGGSASGPAKTFAEAGLREVFPNESLQSVLDGLQDPTTHMTNPRSDGEIHGKAKPKRPPAVGSSPVQLHCRLCTEVPLYGSKTMILLQVDTYVIHQSVLRKQTTLHPNPISIQGNPDARKITAKIDCLLLAPLATLGNGKFGTVKTIYHMGRPRPTPSSELNEDTCNKVSWEDHTRWEIDNLIPADSNSCSELKYNIPHAEPITYSYCIDHHCPLGYNPMKQLVCPRLIGWISTYEPSSLNKNEKPIAHVSPYSFFIDVSRGSRPMVAFAACPRTDEFADSDDENSTQPSTSDSRKDAQRDAELTGCFCVNFVSKDLAWAMNVSAAPLGKGLSEFNLMKSGTDKVKSGVTIPTFIKAPLIDAPMVNESPLFMECRYVKTIKIPDVFENDSMYSLIIGEVVNVHATKEFALQSNNGQLELDVQKAKPVARLGYGQEYAVIEEYLQ